jgi:hypothetical protein
MRVIAAVVAVLLLIPCVAKGQTFVHASGGPTLTDQGYSLAAGVGFSPMSRLALIASVDRTHLPSRRQVYPGGFSEFRGGTVTLAAAEVQVSLLGRDRIGPYGLAGFATGVSRPNVTAVFPDRVTHRVGAPFLGGGIQVPLRNRLRLVADARLMLVIGAEADSLFAVAPLRAGLAWDF